MGMHPWAIKHIQFIQHIQQNWTSLIRERERDMLLLLLLLLLQKWNVSLGENKELDIGCRSVCLYVQLCMRFCISVCVCACERACMLVCVITMQKKKRRKHII